MPYTITLTNGTNLVTVQDGTVDNTTSLTLVGRNYPGYGGYIAENMIHALENFANSSAPGAPLVGQLWWDTSNKILKVYDGTTWSSPGLPAPQSYTGYTFSHAVTVDQSSDQNAGFIVYNSNATSGSRYYRIRVRSDGNYNGHWVLESLNNDTSLNAVILDTDSSGHIKLVASPADNSTPTAIATTGYVASFAPLASPVFTGTPTAPTPSGTDNSTKLATTAFVQSQGYATVNSPTFTGTVQAPTPSIGDNSTKVATTSFVQANSRIKLAADLTLYVATTGSDNNNGLTSGTPFLTIQKAVDTAINNYDTQGHNITVQVADGTYTTGVNVYTRLLGTGSLYIIGNITTPTNCKVTLASAGICFNSEYGATVTVKGFSLTATSGNSGLGQTSSALIAAGAGGTVIIDKIQFNACQNCMIGCNAGYVYASSSTLTIAGNAAYFIAAQEASLVNLVLAAITVTTPVTFSAAVFAASFGGYIGLNGASWGGYYGSVTGQSYSAVYGGSISVSTGITLPGSVAGNSSTGYYVVGA